MSRRCLEVSLDSRSPGPWYRQQLPASASSSLFVLFCWKWGCGSVACAQLWVTQAVSFRPSVRAWGILPWSWDLPGRPPAWCWSLCGCSSSGRHAWPCTCGCKRNTTPHAQRQTKWGSTVNAVSTRHLQNTHFEALMDFRCECSLQGLADWRKCWFLLFWIDTNSDLLFHSCGVNLCYLMFAVMQFNTKLDHVAGGYFGIF